MSDSLTLQEFQRRFATESDCLEYLENIRWPHGFRCPNCGHDDGYRITTRRLIQCMVCRRQTSITSGTVFHKTRVPLQNWFWIIYMMTQDKGGASALRLSQQLGMYYKTVWYIVQKVRHAMGSRDEGITLAGFIELDEALIGPQARKTGRKRRRGSNPVARKKGRKPKTPKRPRKTQTEVIILVERENFAAGNIAMRVVEQSTRPDIQEAIEQKVEQNTQWFKSDAYQPHFVVKSMGHHLQALVLGNSPASCEELPIVHRAISLLKRFLLGTYHGVSPKYLQRYLDEFSFRWNRRNEIHKMCESLVRSCLFTLPITYSEVTL